MNELGNLLRQYRKSKLNENKKKISQLELSLEIGWDNPSTLSRIESGQVKPNRETLIKISEALQLRGEELNDLLSIGGYTKVYNIITPEYKEYLISFIQEEIDKDNYPILILQNSGDQLTWNNCMEKLIYKQYSKFKYNTCVDVFFNNNYGVREFVKNWHEFGEIMVKNIFCLSKHYAQDLILANNIKRWMNDFSEFKSYWLSINGRNDVVYKFFNKPLDFNHPELGLITFSTNVFPWYKDDRFYIKQFIPDNIIDNSKIETYLKNLGKENEV